MAGLRDNLAAVLGIIERSAARAGRRGEEIRLVAVTKGVPAERVAEALAAGLSLFGENRVQEAREKIPRVPGPAEWHLIGHLQSNKAAAAARLFRMIHSLDGARLARRLDAALAAEPSGAGPGGPLPVLVQVNLSGEASKSGLSPGDLRAELEGIASCAHLRVRGLMTIPPLDPDPERARPFFARLRELAATVASWGLPGIETAELSMGMTDDYPVAIEEGATLVRVGRALFGERPSGP